MLAVLRAALRRQSPACRFLAAGLIIGFCMTLGLTFFLPPAYAEEGDLLVHAFYAYGSAEEIGVLKDLDSFSLAWGRIARNAEGKMVFTVQPGALSAADGYPEFSVPSNVYDVLPEIKKAKGKKYLMVFVGDADSTDEVNPLIELLNMDSRALSEQVLRPLADFLSGNPLGIEFDGAVIDLEGLRDSFPGEKVNARYGKSNAALRSKYNSFLQQLDKLLGEKKELLVCVPPNNVYNYCDGYDFSRIGQLADTVILMAHDYHHYTPGNSLPDIAATAPYYLVEDALVKARAAGLPLQKTLLAVCLNGVQWRKTADGWSVSCPPLRLIDDALAGKNGEVLEASPPERYLEKYSWGGSTYDYRVGYVELKRLGNGSLNGSGSKNSQNGSNTAGKTVVTDRFYYENARSLNEKLALMRREGLKGVSVWKLGLGNETAWQTLLARGQFRDLRGHWAREEVEEMAARGIIQGVKPGYFNPDGRMTRAEFAALLVRWLDLPAPSQRPRFKDVKPGDWYYEEVHRAYAAGLIQGRSSEQFCPSDPITREEAAVILVRALRYCQPDLVPSSPPAAAWTDRQKISSWARKDIDCAQAMGLVTGYPSGRGYAFSPRALATRAEGAVLIKRALEKAGPQGK